MAADAGSGRIVPPPFGIGDVLHGTFKVYRRTFLPIITVMAVVAVPKSLLSLIVVLFLGREESPFGGYEAAASNELLAAVLVVAILASLAQLVAAGAAVRVVADSILGRPVSVGDAYREALGRFRSLLLVSICISVPIAVLVITCIAIPVAVYVGLGWSLAYQAIVLEGRGAIDSMRRSWTLVSGHRWRVLVCVGLIGLIAWLLVSVPAWQLSFVSVIVMLATGAPDSVDTLVNIGDAIVQAAGQTLFGAIGSIATTLLYYDLRVADEGLDLNLRAAVGETPVT